MKTNQDTSADTFGDLGKPIRPEPKPDPAIQKRSEFETYNWAPDGLRIKPSPAPQPGYSIGGVIVEEDADLSIGYRLKVSDWARELLTTYGMPTIKRHSRDEQTDD